MKKKIKAERNNKNAENVEPLFTLSHYHAGIYRKAPISAETVLLVLVGATVYYATTLKLQFKH